MKKALLAAVLLATGPAIRADIFDGKELMARCGSQRIDEVNTCVGYLAGIADSDRAAPAWRSTKSLFCVPQGVTTGQLRKVLIDYVGQHPEQTEFNAAILVGNAFIEAFPCD